MYSLPIENKKVLNIDLTIKTSNKNKELIIESLFKENILFSLDFDKEDSYELSNDLINSQMKYFCNSIIEEEKFLLNRKYLNQIKLKIKKFLLFIQSHT